MVKGKFGVHGESLGGSVATYIASKMPLHFNFVNRTFASLQHEAYAFGGIFLLKLFTVLTLGGWPNNALKNFKNLNTENNCYRIFGADSHDTIVPNKASLKTAIVSDLITSKRQIQPQKYELSVSNYLLSDERKKMLIDDLTALFQ